MVVNAFGDRWSYIQVDSYWWILMALVCRACQLETEDQAEGRDEAVVGLEPQIAGA
jgi:hypothetical protein